jgi:pimeloyl-ACP methyl ester carboxylesterase
LLLSLLPACRGKKADAALGVGATAAGSVGPGGAAQQPSAGPPLFRVAKLRARLSTKISAPTDHSPAVAPPAGVLEKVFYDAPLGKNVAYVSPVKPGAKRPAIVWIAGGMDWGIGSSAWDPQPRDNDQSARAFREAGISLMLPALRGSNESPGHNECFLGEVDDILAAGDFLAKRPDVDPTRVYLGGHSTGGTLVLLAAESTDRFRATFAFGPVADPRQYGDGGCLPATVSDIEAVPRSPVDFLRDIRTPTFVIEGARSGNAGVFPLLKKAKGPAPVEFRLIPDADHFTALASATEALAAQILADTTSQPSIEVDVKAIAARAAKPN